MTSSLDFESIGDEWVDVSRSAQTSRNHSKA